MFLFLFFFNSKSAWVSFSFFQFLISNATKKNDEHLSIRHRIPISEKKTYPFLSCVFGTMIDLN